MGKTRSFSGRTWGWCSTFAKPDEHLLLLSQCYLRKWHGSPWLPFIGLVYQALISWVSYSTCMMQTLLLSSLQRCGHWAHHHTDGGSRAWIPRRASCSPIHVLLFSCTWTMWKRKCEGVPWTPEVVGGKRKTTVDAQSPVDQLLQWLQSPSQTSHLEGKIELQSHSLRTHDPSNNMENHWL